MWSSCCSTGLVVSFSLRNCRETLPLTTLQLTARVEDISVDRPNQLN